MAPRLTAWASCCFQPAATDVPQPAANDVPQLAANDVPQPAATDVPQPAANDVPQPAATDFPQPAANDVPQPAATDFLKFCQGIMGKLDNLMNISRSSQEYLMNENQCLFLVKRLSETLAGIPHSSHPDKKTSLVFQELRYVFEDAHRLIQSCCIKSTASNSEPIRAAIEQGDMKHTFAKLLFDVRWHTDVLQSILDDSGGPSSTFEAARYIGDLSGEDITALKNAKEKDDKVLNDRLRSLKLDHEPERHLAYQFLQHRDEQAQLNKDLRHDVLLLHEADITNHLDGNPIGKGSFGEVRETDVLGGCFAVKIVIERNSSAGNEDSTFKKEMVAMQGLGHHPNIVRLYCFSKINERCFLIMERMDDDLARILEHRGRNMIKVSLVEKVVLMLEIAEGMRYIHSMRMAHRDLKPGNVLVNLKDQKKKSSRAYSVKIADFGLTKTKDASRTYTDQTTNMGTPRYMAPEVIDFERTEKKKFNPTKADVYSFGIMCFEILTGQTAFGENEKMVVIRKQVKGNGDFRPDLQPGSGPLRLQSLIQRCWALNHRSRPAFERICQELRYIKGLLLRGDHQKLETKINFTGDLGSPDMTEQVLKFCQVVIDKFDDLLNISPSSQEYLMNEEQCLFLVKRLSETLASIPHSSHLNVETSLVFQELRYVFVDADRLIQSCCMKSTASDLERLRAAIEQGDLKHTFAKLVYDVRWHTYVLQSILEDSGDPRTTFEAARCIGDLSDEDITALKNAKEKDDKVLNDRLRSLKLDREPERGLAYQLLRHRDAEAKSNRDLGHGVLLLCEEEMRKHLHGSRMGKGSSGEVRETNILGGRLAVKIISQSRSDEVEMKAMQGLGHHPNIVRLYCSSRMNEECFLIMERMDNDLDGILGDKKRNRIEVSLVEKVVLMLEIAEGMSYIHRMHMAHRDLKPSNILVNLEDPKKISSRTYSVKIADFGLTKTKDASRTYKDQTTNMGTSRYMAPEVIAFGNNEKGEFNPTKADVYSFGIMCFEILTGQPAFGKIENWVVFKKEVKGNGDFRPDLQSGSGPLRLQSLIQRCWAREHRSRPDFERICQELRYIKGLLLRGDDQKLETKINFTGDLGSPDMTEQHQGFAQATPVRQGPWGRNEPKKTTGLFDYMAASIKWIRVKYQQNPPGLGLLEVKYVEADGQEVKQTYCRDVIGTTYTEIKLEPGEYIKQVSGCVATHSVSVGNGGTVGLYCVVSLTIHTNLKSYGPFGDETKSVSGHRFKSGTGKVVGFFGATGVLIDKLGVWIIPDGQEHGDPSYLVDQ